MKWLSDFIEGMSRLVAHVRRLSRKREPEPLPEPPPEPELPRETVEGSKTVH